MSSKILKGSLLAIAIAGGTIGSTTAVAQSADGSIRGSVMGADSSTIVVISDKTRGLSKSISVGDSGSFRSGSLAPGTYTVTVSKNGKVVDAETVGVVISGTTKSASMSTKRVLRKSLSVAQELPLLTRASVKSAWLLVRKT